MRQIGEPSKLDARIFPGISRRLLLEGSVTASFIAIGSSWSRDANAVGPEPTSRGPARQAAAYSVRQAATQAYVHERLPRLPELEDSLGQFVRAFFRKKVTAVWTNRAALPLPVADCAQAEIIC